MKNVFSKRQTLVRDGHQLESLKVPGTLLLVSTTYHRNFGLAYDRKYDLFLHSLPPSLESIVILLKMN